MEHFVPTVNVISQDISNINHVHAVLVYFPVTLIKYCDKDNLGEKKFILIHSQGNGPSWQRN